MGQLIFLYVIIYFSVICNLPRHIKKVLGYILLSVIGIVVLMFIITALYTGTDSADSYATITGIDYKAIVYDSPGSDGRVYVTERLTFDVHAPSDAYDELCWELWRVLPETEWAWDTAVYGTVREYRVNSVKQILDDGSTVKYAESPKLYWDWEDYYGVGESSHLGPGMWYHSKGPYNGYDRFECVLFYVDGLYKGQVTFEIEYEMTNAALRYADSSELYLVFAYDEDVTKLKSFDAQILFPDDIMPRSGNYDAYTYGTDSHTLPFTESDSVNPGYHTFSISLDSSKLRFKPYNQYLEFSLVAYGDDKHIFTQNAMENYFHNMDMLDETNKAQAEYEAIPGRYMLYKTIVFTVCVVIAVFVLWYAFSIDKRMKKKYVFFDPVHDIEYFRDIPADIDSNFAAVLVFCKHKTTEEAIDKDGYAAVMLSLVRKGYIELERIRETADWAFKNIKIVIRHNPNTVPAFTGTEPLTVVEKLYLDLIIRHSNGYEVTLNNFNSRIQDDYEYTGTFVKNVHTAVTNMGLQDNYFQRRDFNKPYKSIVSSARALWISAVLIMAIFNYASIDTRMGLVFGAYFILGFSFITAAVYMQRKARKYHLLTQFGEDEYAKWRGLYNFLKSDTLMNEQTVVSLPIWEKYLIYATEFGISEKVVKALKIKGVQMGININASPVLRNPYYTSNAFRATGRTIRYSTRAAARHSAVARSGRGGFGGGGGGGFGGGVGGGG